MNSPRKRDLRLSGQIWGDPHETRAAVHSTSTVHPIHDVQPMMSSRITGAQTHRPGPRWFEPPAGPCREYRCRQILRETKSNHRQE